MQGKRKRRRRWVQEPLVEQRGRLLFPISRGVVGVGACFPFALMPELWIHAAGQSGAAKWLGSVSSAA